MSKRGELAKLLATLAVGGVAGAAIMSLLVPRSGRETRAQLKEQVVNKLPKKRQALAGQNLKRISNWGNYPNVEVEFYEFEDIATLRQILSNLGQAIPRGNGRCYGDSALAPQVISTLRYNKFLSFDNDKGTIHCQAGVLLSEVLDVIVPRGWFLPVTPGTKLITVGGAIGSDVHGKGQHKAGNFSDHVLEMEIMLGDGSIVTCSKTENTDLFWTTCGGMGLTGVVLNAKLRLIPIETAYIRQEMVKARNLDHLMDLFEESEMWPYSLAWIDCLARGDSMGRGVLMRGDHAKGSELVTKRQQQNPLNLKKGRRLNVPLNFPGFAINNLSIKIFNMLYYAKHPNGLSKSIIDYDTFFYPLDGIANWNRIYGQRGFTQYQFILPKTESRAGLHKILKKISDNGQGSFVSVLKLYDKQNSYLPFAMKGFSLALDFPITEGLFSFLDELDQIVLEYRGRLYLTKDVRMNKTMFMQSYPNVDQFIDKINNLNHSSKFRSFQSDRVGLTS